MYNNQAAKYLYFLKIYGYCKITFIGTTEYEMFSSFFLMNEMNNFFTLHI